VSDLLARAEEIQRESAARLAASEQQDGELDAGVVMLLFEAAAG
jgi:hypothetical protein